MKEIFLIALMGWLVGCEPKPVEQKYVQYAALVQEKMWVRRFFSDSFGTKGYGTADTNLLREYMESVDGGIREGIHDGIQDFDNQADPDPMWGTGKQAQKMLSVADSVVKLDQYVLWYTIEGKQNLTDNTLHRLQQFKQNGSREMNKLDSMLRFFKEVHGVTDKDVWKVVKR